MECFSRYIDKQIFCSLHGLLVVLFLVELFDVFVAVVIFLTIVHLKQF